MRLNPPSLMPVLAQLARKMRTATTAGGIARARARGLICMMCLLPVPRSRREGFPSLHGPIGQERCHGGVGGDGGKESLICPLKRTVESARDLLYHPFHAPVRDRPCPRRIPAP